MQIWVYLGWDEKQVAEYLNYYGLASYTQEIFEIVVEEPGNYLSYFIGYMEMMNLRETAEEAWGENFTLKKFHEADAPCIGSTVLTTG